MSADKEQTVTDAQIYHDALRETRLAIRYADGTEEDKPFADFIRERDDAKADALRLHQEKMDLLDEKLSTPRTAAADIVSEPEYLGIEALYRGDVKCSDELPAEQRPQSINAKRLFRYVHELKAEVDRYRKGMENWKRTAEAKDRESVEARSAGADIKELQRQVGLGSRLLDAVRGWVHARAFSNSADLLNAEWKLNETFREVVGLASETRPTEPQR